MPRNAPCWTPAPPPAPPAIARLAINMREAGRALGVCSRTIGEMVRRKELRAVKCGRRTVIPVSELHRLLGLGEAT